MPLLLNINKAGGRAQAKGLAPSDIGVTQGELNSAVEKLIKLGLVRRVQSNVLLHTGELELTEKGQSVASRLAEIQLLLTEKKRTTSGDNLDDLPVARNFAEEKKARRVARRS
jgi:DNA-binding HxlR family transcriptional regulator